MRSRSFAPNGSGALGTKRTVVPFTKFTEPATCKPVESVTTMLASDTLAALTGAEKVSRIGALTSSVPVGQVT